MDACCGVRTRHAQPVALPASLPPLIHVWRSKFAINFDDGAKEKFMLQWEQWEPLDLELLQQRQQAQRAAAEADAAAAAAAAAASLPQRHRAPRATAAAPVGGYAALGTGAGEEAASHMEWEGDAGAAPLARVPPPPVDGAATGAPPPPSPAPRGNDQLPDPLPLSPEAERSRKAQVCLWVEVGLAGWASPGCDGLCKP